MLRAYGNVFLDASLYHYNRLCPLVGRSVSWLVGWLVSNAFNKDIKILHFLNSNMVLPSKSIIHVVIHSLNHLFIYK